MKKSIPWSLAIGALALATPLALAAINKGDESQTAAGPASVSSQNKELTREFFTEDEVAPRVAPEGYDLTIVKYTDYQCPYCRMAHDNLQTLTAKDKKIRIIYRDWPVFGAASVSAAKASIASKWQGKHSAFHDALMRTPGKVSDETIRAAARKAGVDWARLQADLKSHEAEIEALLERNSRQAAELGLQGTPGFLIGNYLIPGGMDLATLRESVKNARENPDPPKQEEEESPQEVNGF
jgi:protein-disulfide isomerase